MNSRHFLPLFAATCCLPQVVATEVNFSREILPVLSDYCFRVTARPKGA